MAASAAAPFADNKAAVVCKLIFNEGTRTVAIRNPDVRAKLAASLGLELPEGISGHGVQVRALQSLRFLSAWQMLQQQVLERLKDTLDEFSADLLVATVHLVVTKGNDVAITANDLGYFETLSNIEPSVLCEQARRLRIEAIGLLASVPMVRNPSPDRESAVRARGTRCSGDDDDDEREAQRPRLSSAAAAPASAAAAGSDAQTAAAAPASAAAAGSGAQTIRTGERQAHYRLAVAALDEADDVYSPAAIPLSELPGYVDALAACCYPRVDQAQKCLDFAALSGDELLRVMQHDLNPIQKGMVGEVLLPMLLRKLIKPEVFVNAENVAQNFPPAYGSHDGFLVLKSKPLDFVQPALGVVPIPQRRLVAPDTPSSSMTLPCGATAYRELNELKTGWANEHKGAKHLTVVMMKHDYNPIGRRVYHCVVLSKIGVLIVLKANGKWMQDEQPRTEKGAIRREADGIGLDSEIRLLCLLLGARTPKTGGANNPATYPARLAKCFANGRKCRLGVPGSYRVIAVVDFLAKPKSGPPPAYATGGCETGAASDDALTDTDDDDDSSSEF